MQPIAPLPKPTTTILLLEDSRAIREIVKLFLGARFEYLEAETGERALILVQLTKPALVVADVNVQGLDGIGFLKAVRNDPSPNVRQIPVVLLTGNKSDELLIRAKAQGASAVLHKPVSSAVLNGAVDDCLRKTAQK